MAMRPTCPSWSTTRGLVLLSPPAPAWFSARAALLWGPLEETSFANAITSFAQSLSSPGVQGQPLPTSQGGLSARWASVRWSGSVGLGRQPRGVWVLLQGVGAAVGAPGRAVGGYLALNKVQKLSCGFKGPGLSCSDLWIGHWVSEEFRKEERDVT